MIEYYAILIMVICSMSVMLVVTYSDKMLPSKSRHGFLLLFSTIMLLALAEWLGFYMEREQIVNRSLSIFRILLMFSIVPIAPIAVVSSIGEMKFDRIFKIVFGVNFVLQILSAKFGFIYYIDEFSVYHRGDFYFIYIMSFTFSLLLLYISFYNLSKKYQHQGDYILVLIGAIIAVGITIQMMYPNIYSVWLSISLGAILLYIYFYTLLAQTDPLTILLNRRCFDNQLQNLKSNAIIIYFDANNFKDINDNLGHSFGDFCLQVIGRDIKKVYSAYGNCYRIGGDEFSVIFTKNLNEIEQVNRQFKDEIISSQNDDMRIPSVSVGYGYHYKSDDDVSNAIENADKMMYENKRHNKETKIMV